MTALSSSQVFWNRLLLYEREEANSKLLEDKKYTKTESCKLKIKYF